MPSVDVWLEEMMPPEEVARSEIGPDDAEEWVRKMYGLQLEGAHWDFVRGYSRILATEGRRPFLYGFALLLTALVVRRLGGLRVRSTALGVVVVSAVLALPWWRRMRQHRGQLAEARHSAVGVEAHQFLLGRHWDENRRRDRNSSHQVAIDTLRRNRDETEPFGLLLRGYFDEGSVQEIVRPQAETKDELRVLSLARGERVTAFVRSMGSVGSTERWAADACRDQFPLVTLDNSLFGHPGRFEISRMPVVGDWRQKVAELIRRAAIIIVELSEYTPGILEELRILTEEEAVGRTIVVIDTERASEFTRDLTRWSGAVPKRREAPTEVDAVLAAFPNIVRLDEIVGARTHPAWMRVLRDADRYSMNCLINKARIGGVDPSTARDLAGRALEICHGPNVNEPLEAEWVEVLIAECDVELGRRDDAIQRLSALAPGFDRAGDAGRAGHTRTALCRALWKAERLAEAEAEARLAVETLADTDYSADRLMAQRVLAESLRDQAAYEAARVEYENLLELGRSDAGAEAHVSAEAELRAHTGIGQCAAFVDLRQAVESFTAALDLATALNETDKGNEIMVQVEMVAGIVSDRWQSLGSPEMQAAMEALAGAIERFGQAQADFSG